MLTWPHAGTDWRNRLDQVEALYLLIAREIAARETLLVVCHDGTLRKRVAGTLLAAGIPAERCITVTAACDDTWARDYGPLVALNGSDARIKDFRFNGWGDKYPAARDDRVSAEIHAAGVFGRVAFDSLPQILEGGAVETDGQGTLLATRSSLIDPRRNNRLDQADWERIIHRHLGLDRFLWLDQGRLSGDDTDGHIDTLARFCDPQTILYTTALADDPDRVELEAMARQLARFRTREGKAYRLIPLPPIAPIRNRHGNRLPASYANFLILNGAVLLPVYAAHSDAQAIECLARCFPERQILPIDCRPLIEQYGSLHCISMQFPRELALQ